MKKSVTGNFLVVQFSWRLELLQFWTSSLQVGMFCMWLDKNGGWIILAFDKIDDFMICWNNIFFELVNSVHFCWTKTSPGCRVFTGHIVIFDFLKSELQSSWLQCNRCIENVVFSCLNQGSKSRQKSCTIFVVHDFVVHDFLAESTIFGAFFEGK